MRGTLPLPVPCTNSISLIIIPVAITTAPVIMITNIACVITVAISIPVVSIVAAVIERSAAAFPAGGGGGDGGAVGGELG